MQAARTSSCDSQSYDALEVRFSATVREDPEIEVGLSNGSVQVPKKTKTHELTFHAVLGDDFREVRFERILARQAFGSGGRNTGVRAHP